MLKTTQKTPKTPSKKQVYIWMHDTPYYADLLRGDFFGGLLDATMRNRSIWGFDSEFLMSGRINEPSDVCSVQFSDGSLLNSVVLEDADSLKDWLHNHEHVKALFGFVVLPDLGSIEEWLGEKHVSIKTRGVQTIGEIKYRGFNAKVYDARPLLANFGLRRLEDCGRVVGFPKLPKPDWLGLRKAPSKSERDRFVEYAKADAIITSRIVKWLADNFGADPEKHASAGTLARDTFALPKRLRRVKRTIVLPPLERMVKTACFAGRSEGFITGFSPSVTYNDVKSLYPCSLVATRALDVVSATPCNVSDLNIDKNADLNDARYGWVEGVFETHNDLWGLPLRGSNNFYANGVVSGFYHTFDLIAAKAEVLAVAHAYQPIFKRSKTHDAYADMLINRLDGRMSETERMFAKGVLNSLSGKLGQSKPCFSRTSNFFAYSTVLAHSHLLMSRLFDKCAGKIYAMDTDSIFSDLNMAGKHFELSDGERSIPIIMSVKGCGDLSFFRSKNYILKPKDIDLARYHDLSAEDRARVVVGRHGWQYFYEDFLKLADGSITELRTRKDIKHTLLTRAHEALKMAKGRWKTRPVTLSLAKIKALLNADKKRRRSNYDSYGLVMQKCNVKSKAWVYEDLMCMEKENPLDYPKVQ
jgi:hypothetical protein